MKKTIFITVIFLLSTLVCLSKTSTEDIKINNEIYNQSTNDSSNRVYYEDFKLIDEGIHTNIQIEYPQLKGMKSLKIQQKINKLIKEKAIYTLYDEEEEIKKGLNLNVKAEVKYLSLDLISIKYTAQSHYWNTMKVYEIIYATNINIETGELLNYKALFNNSFRAILNRKVFKYSSPDKAIKSENLDVNSYEYGYLHGENEILRELFDKFYNDFRESNYYFNKTKFTIIVEIPDGSGTNIELSTDYSNMRNVINNKYKIWNEFIK